MKIEVRAGNAVHIEGYVNAVERDSHIITVPSIGQCVEQIRAGVFDKALRAASDVMMLENHDETRRLGSISEGNLKLYEDNIGLRAIADIVDADIADKARRKLLKGWSFGFVCTENEIEKRAGNVPRRIVKGMMLSEVSLIDGSMKPCYSGTSVEVRADGFIREFRAADDDNIEYSILDSVDTSTDVENRAADGENSTDDSETVETRSEEPDYSYYDAMLRYLELRYNPYHDDKGRFCSGGGGGGGGVMYVPNKKKGEKGMSGDGSSFYIGMSDRDSAEQALANEFDKWQKNKQKPKRKTKAELQREEYANARQYLNEWDGNVGTSQSKSRSERIDSYIQAKEQLGKYKEKIKKFGFDDEGDVRDYLTAYARVTTAGNDHSLSAVDSTTRKSIGANEISIVRNENKYSVGSLGSGGYKTYSNPMIEIEISQNC